MRNLSTELKVGLLILIGIGLIVYASVIVTGWRPGAGDTYTVFAYFDNVAGLLEGAPAQVAGIKIGEVRSIELEAGRARVGIAVNRRYRLYANASVTIKSLGILGDKYIEVHQGTPTQLPLKDGDTITILIPGSDLDSLVESTAIILRDVRSITGNLRESLGGPAGLDKINTIIDELVATARNLNRITEVTNQHIDAIAGNLSRFTASLDRIGAQNEGPIGNTTRNLESLTDGLNRLIVENQQSLANSARSLEKLTASLERMTTDNEAAIGASAQNLRQFTEAVSRITGDNEAGIKATVANLASFSKELEAITVQNRQTLDKLIADLGTFTQSLAQDGPRITQELRQVLEENRAELTRTVANLSTFSESLATNGPRITENLDGILQENRTLLHTSVANLDRSFEQLNHTMSNLDSVTGKLERGEGSLGKLINDETTVNELNSALQGINSYLTDVTRIKLDIGGRTEHLSRQDEYKSYVSLQLQPLKSRWYTIELVDNPRGNVQERTIVRKTTGTTSSDTTTKEVETTQELQLSLLVSQRYFDTVVRGGLMENTFGLGLSQLFGQEDQYSLGLDVWDFGGTFGPHAKFTGLWKFYSNAFLTGGFDDFTSERDKLRDTFLGVGITFNEDSLRPLVSSLPISGVTGK